MPDINLNVFQAYASAHADTAHVDVDEVQRWQASWLGFRFGLAPAPTAESDSEALATFRAAMQEHYGAFIAGQAVPHDGTESLSSARILDAVRAADTLDAARQAAFDAARAPNATAAQREAALDAVMADVRWPKGAHGVLLQEPVRRALEPLLAPVLACDATPTRALLASLGTQLAARMEAHLLRAMRHDDAGFYARPIIETVEALGNHAGLLQVAPALGRCLEIEARGFQTSIRTLLARVQDDLAMLHQRFGAGGTPPAGLTGLRLTDSDPHKGGNRVAILTLGQTQVVYKPRDVRIDEAISGRDLQSSHRSLMQLAGAERMTYRFLPRQDADDVHYGYVEHLPHGRVEDHLIEARDAGAFFGDLGRGIAALMMAGATDIHHENMIVSRGVPYFTDLELAFAPSTLAPLDQLLRLVPNALPPTPQSDPLLAATDALMHGMVLDYLFANSIDSNPLLPGTLVHDGRFEQIMTTSDVPESIVAVRDAQSGRIQDNRTARQSFTPGEDLSLYARHAGPLAAGVRAGLVAIRQAEQNGSQQYSQFLRDVGPYQIRHHPINTLTQREILVGQLLRAHDEHNLPAIDQVLDGTAVNAMLRDEVAGLTLHSPHARGPLREAMEAALALFDIPYFSRVVAEHSLRPDGGEPMSWYAPRSAVTHDQYFNQRADAPMNGLMAQLMAADDGTLDRLEAAFVRWFGTREPLGGELAVIDGTPDYQACPTRDLLAAIRGTAAPPRAWWQFGWPG